MLITGATHLTRCPVQSLIPIYLIVMGAGSLVSLSLTYTMKAWNDGAVYILSAVCTTLLHLFSFCWFISGGINISLSSELGQEIRCCIETRLSKQ